MNAMDLSPQKSEENFNFKSYNNNGVNDGIIERPSENSSPNASPKKTRHLGLKSIDDVENMPNNRVNKLGSIHNRSDTHHASVIKNVVIEKKNIVSMREFLNGLDIPEAEAEKLERKLGTNIFYFELKKGSTEWT